MKKVIQPASLEGLWRQRDKHPEQYPFTDDGNIRAIGYTDPKSKQSVPEKVYALQSYRHATPDELEALWAQRDSAYEPIYEKIEAAKSELRTALLAFQTSTGTAKGVVEANQKVRDVEAELVLNRSPQRWIEQLGGVAINQIDMEDKYEKRKFQYDIYVLKGSAIKNQDHYVEDAGGVQVASGGGMEITYKIITDESVLGLHWPAEIQIGKTKYFTAFQAILGEVALSMSNTSLFESILGTRSSRTLRTLTKDLKIAEYSSEVFQKVIEASIEQLPNYKEELLKTGDQILLYANELDELFSIGIAAEEIQPGLPLPKKWRGENLWGEELVKARTELREKEVSTKPEDIGKKELEEASNSVISEVEQKAAKVGAIIHARRRRG
jgi:predicted NAD-dependent protein-ADP-ribosyltransferase YbiA (DUF1768 family)